MVNLKKITLLLVVLMFSTLLATSVSATDFSETTVKHDFNPTNFTFCYNDHNTSTYEGDTGLKGAYCKSTADNYTYWVPVENVRGLAYASKGTFKFIENIDITRSLHSDDRDYDYIMLKMYHKNGTEIPTLDVSDDDLTVEQQKYFDNYEQERQDYYQEQQQEDLDSMSDYSYSSSSNNHRSHYGYYVGTRGAGIIYTP